MQFIIIREEQIILITCKELAESIKAEVKTEIDKLKHKPTLAIISNNKPDGERYIRNKVKVAEEVGIQADVFTLSEDDDIKQFIRKLCDYTGIIIQMPYYDDKAKDEELVHKIPFFQDVDGLTGWDMVTPATTLGVYKYLETNNLIEGKNITIIGRSKLVGMPLAKLLLNTNATVTLCHSRTRNLSVHTLEADVIVCAVGKREFITSDMISKYGTTHIIDVGINFDDNGKMCGDVAKEVKEMPNVVATPVPNGVGLLTTACLMYNALELEKVQDDW